MFGELKTILTGLKRGVEDLKNNTGFELKKKRIDEITKLSQSEEFWMNVSLSQKIMKEKTDLEREIKEIENMDRKIEDLNALIELGEEADDIEIYREAESMIEEIKKGINFFELQKMMFEENDDRNAIVSINSGAGGTEACDWVTMLLRMYIKWCDNRNYKTTIVDSLEGDEAGLKNVTFTVEGKYAYGYLKAETGIHRLVRISPFDANKRRHTSFASAFVIPEIDDRIDIVIKDEDLRIDTYRASGAGGQHVNKTSSAVRITHIPTGIVVQCQNERSQHQNKATALKILKARLYERELSEKEKEREKLYASQKDISWGSQIRSYILHPYKLVKDHRTGYEETNADAVLDGYIDGFIEAYLKKNLSKREMEKLGVKNILKGGV